MTLSETDASNTPHVYSVSELNEQARLMLENQFRTCWLEGEISNLSQPASGHIYLTLKDQRAQLRAALFRNRNRGLQFRPANGMQVLVKGQLTLYTVRGDYQLIIEDMREAGLGALQRAFEALKQQLSQEGLFAEERKRRIPRPPRVVGIITSASGAALQDMLSIFKRRSPLTRVIVYPAQVQGADAPGQLIAALQIANRRQECEVLVIARGGGSLEDLWAFNNRELAYAIAASALPVVSAVGHQTDVTISDFVADLRAATPSAAAELLSNDISDLRQALSLWQQRLERLMLGVLRRHRERWSQTDVRLKHPDRRLQEFSQRLDELEARLTRAMQGHLHLARQQLNTRQATLRAQTPQHQLRAARLALRDLQRRMLRQGQTRIANERLRYQHLVQRLDAISPLATLSRGYAIVQSEQGNVITDSGGCRPGDTIQARLHRGRLTATVVSVDTAAD